MPSLQVVDFGPSPLTENMGKFASGFSDAFFKQQTQKKNEDIFKRIKDSYGADASPDRIFREILESEGLDQEYKSDLMKVSKDYATVEAMQKKNAYQEEMQSIRREELGLKQEKQALIDDEGITPYQRRNLDTQNRRLDILDERIKIAKNKDAKDLPSTVSKYFNTVLQGTDEKLSIDDKTAANRRTLANVRNGMETAEAVDEALQFIKDKKQVMDNAKLAGPPVAAMGFFGRVNPSQQQFQQAFEAAYKQLEELYDFGIESQTELRKLATRAGWTPEQANIMLQELFQRRGRKARTQKPQQEIVEEAVEDPEADAIFINV